VSAFLEIAPCAASAVPGVAGGRLCPGIVPVSGHGFKLSQLSVAGGTKIAEKPPADGVYTLVYDVCVETFPGECRFMDQPASRRWRVTEDPIQLVPGRNWLTRLVDLGDGRKVVHSFVVDW
jgi:hypothetical protein